MSPRPGSVNNGPTTRVTRKGYAVPGDRRHQPKGVTSIKKDGGRRSVTGAERQSKAEPGKDGKALGGSAVHYKRSSNTSTRRGGASLLSFFTPPTDSSPQSLTLCNLPGRPNTLSYNLGGLILVQFLYNGDWEWNSPDSAGPLPVVRNFSRVKRDAGN